MYLNDTGLFVSRAISWCALFPIISVLISKISYGAQINQKIEAFQKTEDFLKQISYGAQSNQKIEAF